MRYKDSNESTNLLTVSLNCLSDMSLVMGPSASSTDSETLGSLEGSHWLYSTSKMMENSVTKLSLMDVMLSFSTLSPICSETATAKWPKAAEDIIKSVNKLPCFILFSKSFLGSNNKLTGLGKEIS